jgi:hypothetical protein
MTVKDEIYVIPTDFAGIITRSSEKVGPFSIGHRRTTRVYISDERFVSSVHVVIFSVVVLFFLAVLVVWCRRGRGKPIREASFDLDVVYTVTNKNIERLMYEETTSPASSWSLS